MKFKLWLIIFCILVYWLNSLKYRKICHFLLFCFCLEKPLHIQSSYNTYKFSNGNALIYSNERKFRSYLFYLSSQRKKLLLHNHALFTPTFFGSIHLYLFSRMKYIQRVKSKISVKHLGNASLFPLN